jgi:hypothetical protein
VDFMSISNSRIHDQCTCAVEVLDGEVDAGQGFRVRASAHCPHDCDLSGVAIAFHAPAGEVVTATLGESDDGYATDEVTLTAPPLAGHHPFIATIVPAADGPVHAAAPATFEVAAKAHSTRLNAWDMPSAVIGGETFRFKVGVNCSAGCRLAGQSVTLLDAAQRPVAVARLGDEVWPGTTALFFAEMTAQAPQEAGRHEWTLSVPVDETASPHAAGAATLAINVVEAPEFEVTIETVAQDGQTPIKGARIVMHPYRAISDERGIARLRAAGGDYTILVSAAKHMPIRREVALSADLNTRAELEHEPPAANPDDFY